MVASHEDPVLEQLSRSDLFELAKMTLRLICQIFANMDNDILEGCLNHLKVIDERENPRQVAKRTLSTVLRGV
jgi:hypothetical protein